MKIIRSSLRHVSAFALVLAALGQGAAAADEPSFESVDLELRKSIGETDRITASRHLDEAERLLLGIDSTRSSALDRTGLDITVRTALIDSLRDVSTLEQSRDVLGSVRALTKLVDLSRNLAEAAQIRAARNGTARKPESADPLVLAFYQKLEKTAALRSYAPVTLSTLPEEKLLFRTFTIGGNRRLTAFELAGNSKTHTAVWREAHLQNASDAIIASAGRVVRKGDARPTELLPFLLVLSGDLVNSADFAVEERMQAPASDLVGRAIMPLVITPADFDRPYTLVPSVEESAEVSSLVNAGAVLIHRETRTEIYRWHSLSNMSDFKAISVAAVEVADELSRDVAPPRRSAVSVPPTLKSFLPDAPQRREESGRLLAVTEPVLASVVGSAEKITLEPQIPLLLSSTISSGWAQYKIQDSNRLVWLRRSRVGPFRQVEERKTGGKEPKQEAKEAPRKLDLPTLPTERSSPQ